MAKSRKINTGFSEEGKYMIAIVDYGFSNSGSIRNMLNHMGINSCVTSSAEEILKSSAIILPGVGSFDMGMNNLQNLGLIAALNHKILTKKTPFLGICLGMQLIFEGSEEGVCKGFGWVPGYVKRFQGVPYIPHMGWNYLCDVKMGGIIGEGLKKYYFVHSYYVEPAFDNVVVANAEYVKKFAAVINKDNIYGVQFHPEKSHNFGKEIFENFVKII